MLFLHMHRVHSTYGAPLRQLGCSGIVKLLKTGGLKDRMIFMLQSCEESCL